MPAVRLMSCRCARAVKISNPPIVSNVAFGPELSKGIVLWLPMPHTCNFRARDRLRFVSKTVLSAGDTNLGFRPLNALKLTFIDGPFTVRCAR